MARERQPRRIGQALSTMLGGLDRGGWGYSKARVSTAWEEVAGERIALHTTGAYLRGTEMVIYVDSPVWAQELQAMSGQFREAINDQVGEELVSALRFTVSKNVAKDAEREAKERTSETEYVRETYEDVELDSGELALAEEQAEAIDDPEVREAFLRARKASLRWKKGSDGPKTP